MTTCSIPGTYLGYDWFERVHLLLADGSNKLVRSNNMRFLEDVYTVRGRF